LQGKSLGFGQSFGMMGKWMRYRLMELEFKRARKSESGKNKERKKNEIIKLE
jgi:hypothetical protein